MLAITLLATIVQHTSIMVIVKNALISATKLIPYNNSLICSYSLNISVKLSICYLASNIKPQTFSCLIPCEGSYSQLIVALQAAANLHM